MIMVKQILSSLTIEDSPKDQAFEKLMRRFELNKKIVAGYDDNLKNPASDNEVSKHTYQKIATSFCLQAMKKKDVRFYNTALKISKSKNFTLPKIEF